MKPQDNEMQTAEEYRRDLERLIQAHRDYFEEYRDARFPPSEYAMKLREKNDEDQ